MSSSENSCKGSTRINGFPFGLVSFSSLYQLGDPRPVPFCFSGHSADQDSPLIPDKSVAKASCDLRTQSDFAKQMHIFHFHSSLIDDQSKLLDYTSELSLFCWYQDLFKKLFQESLQNPSTTRHSISFPGPFSTQNWNFRPENLNFSVTEPIT